MSVPGISGFIIYGLEKRWAGFRIRQEGLSLKLGCRCWSRGESAYKNNSLLKCATGRPYFHSTFFTLLSLTFFIIVLTSVRQDGSLGLLPALSNAGVRWLGNCVRGARFVLGAAAPQNLVLDLFSSLLCLLFAFYSASRCRRTIRLPFTGL